MFKLNGYQVTDILFSTPITRVYHAIREFDQRAVILRTCGEQANASQWARLSSSAAILKGFDHANIVSVVDIIDQSGQPCLVMDDIGGVDLRQYAETFEYKQLPIETFLNIAIQLADALSVIHHAQVIHKDLHPGNIVINAETLSVQIIDFGLASLLSREQPALAPPENLEGVLSYISPEQTGRMNRSLDYRTDFYTLGITLYQLLTGDLPFEADDAIGIVHGHIARVQRTVCERRPDVPQVISDIIDKLMQKTAEVRYQSGLGLRQDLEICLRHVVAGRDISAFTLGLNDISDRFQVPQVLYGREQEVEQLMDSFYRAAQGQPQLLAVKGFAGIGKSALIHEVHKPIAAHSGIFTSGKFDQFQKNTPYSALKQALSGWIQHALSLKDSALVALREQLNAALGANGRVLIDFMDVFKVLLGNLAPLPPLGAQETQNRFHQVLQQFIQLITQDRPLVIFIDDLQWADRGTLNLLPQLMSAGSRVDLNGDSSKGLNNDANTENHGCRLLLLVAYRDNEVDDHHPAMHSLKQIEADYASATTLALKPLEVDQINQLLVDALHQTSRATYLLAELVVYKTGGNPFFVNEFLKTLYSEKLLNFDLTQQRWCWSLDVIKAQAITNNVVELMLSKMQKLPEHTQHMLQLGSCIGSLFDLQTLSIISEQTMPETVKQLWPALKEGLLLQEGGDWLLGMVETQAVTRSAVENVSGSAQNVSTRISPLVPHCRFLHDRMLQAAYQSLTEDARQQAHLNIGRLLYEHTEPEQLDQQLFAIVEQLNQGRALIETEAERRQLAQLNLQAAEKAKQASVWEAAERYAQIGVSLLPEVSWKSEYELTYALHLIRTECEFLVSNIDDAQALVEVLLQHAQTPLEKAQVCFLAASQQLAIDTNYCIEKDLVGLGYCHVQVPDVAQIDEDLIEKEHQSLKRLMIQKNWEQEIRIPLGNPLPLETSLAYRLCAQLAAACQVAGNRQLLFYIVYKGMRVALQNGPSEHAIIIYALYSLTLTKQGRYSEANKVANITLELLERYPQCADLPYIYMVLGSFVWHYNHPLRQAIDLQLKAYETGYEYGDIARGVVAGYSNSIINFYAQGLPLYQLNEHLNKLTTIIQKHSVKVLAGDYYRRLIGMLTQPHSKNQLDESAFSAEEWQLIQSCVLRPFIEYLQLQWFFWNDQTDLAWQAVKLAEPALDQMSGFITSLEHRFITALLACRKLPQADTNTQEALKLTLKTSLDELKNLTALCPENFEHKYLLLQAEHGHYQNNSVEQLAPLYEAAIDSAIANGFLQFEALANELYGAFWLDKKLPKMAEGCLNEALRLYKQWGCSVKVKNLTKRYQLLLNEEQVKPKTQGSVQITQSRSAQIRSQTQVNSQEGLDLSTVMKSAQAISSELALKDLVSKVMLAILENSGAQNAALILEGPQGAMIEANIKSYTDGSGDSDINLQSCRLNSATDLPISLISYVLRTNTEQILQDDTNSIISSANTAFIEDPYLQAHQPKSVLCIPVNYREKMIGALYLENMLSYKAFPQARFDIIKMLLAQAAISFENARLFNEVSELNTGLEEKVQRRTQELNQSNEELNDAVKDLKEANQELDSFSYSVSHDLRAPLRTIKGFSNILREDYASSLEPEAQMVLKKVVTSADNMNNLITGLLDLSRLQKQALIRSDVPLSEMAEAIVKDLQSHDTSRHVRVNIQPDMRVDGDPRMLGSVLENLLNNAWKYSSKTEQPEISFTLQHIKGHNTFVVQDNGAGFDMARIDKLFVSFQRLHTESEFAGTGVGLATVKRIINKHGGKIWAEAEVSKGATFYFTLG
jgi:predicted ATPase/signal transduction histidine kinase